MKRRSLRVFIDVKKEEQWLSSQKGWKLTHTNGLIYTFEEDQNEYFYEYIYFEKSRSELVAIKEQIKDKDIEFVCSSFTWALFRKNVKYGELNVYDQNEKYEMLLNKSKLLGGQGVINISLGTIYFMLFSSSGTLFVIASILFYLGGIMLLFSANAIKRYAKDYGD